MRGDFTRNTFDPANNFSRVLMQQGRVTLDADWNEQASILLHFMRTLTLDAFGPHGGPTGPDCGFQIVSKETNDWVGILKRSVDDTDGHFAAQINKGDFLILPGRYYVDGLPVANDKPVLYSEQIGYPYFADGTAIDELRSSTALFYLDVWEQHVTALEDDGIREVALGGPDTCTRARIHAQVRALPVPLTDDGVAQQIDCTYLDNNPIPGLGSGRLRARARLDKPPTDLCAIPPQSRYRGAENQLYRVEIHADGSNAPSPTFVWSRENGSVVLPLTALEIPGSSPAAPVVTIATVEFLGRDQRLGLEAGDLVEVMDDALAASATPGPLAQVQSVDRDKLTVTLQFAAARAPWNFAAGLHPRLVRWDKAGDLTGDGALPVQEAAGSDLSQGWTDLEDGVQIRFEPGGEYRVGDYWLIPARTITGDVDWPPMLDASGQPQTDSDGNPIAAPLPPRGTQHFYAPLAIFMPGHLGAREASLGDCRCFIQRQTVCPSQLKPIAVENPRPVVTAIDKATPRPVKMASARASKAPKT